MQRHLLEPTGRRLSVRVVSLASGDAVSAWVAFTVGWPFLL
jgi:hypothetical protein